MTYVVGRGQPDQHGSALYPRPRVDDRMSELGRRRSIRYREEIGSSGWEAVLRGNGEAMTCASACNRHSEDEPDNWPYGKAGAR